MRSTDYISKGTAVARLYKARDSIPEASQKNFYWWDPNDREVRVKAIDLLINKVMKYGEEKED